MARYTLYAECWGTASSLGREIASSSRLIGLLEVVEKIGHDNFWIRGPGGRYVAGSRREYYKLPSVAKELGRLARIRLARIYLARTQSGAGTA
jgi:hypothetical protein